MPKPRNETITKEAVRKVLLKYLEQYKKYPWHTVASFLLPAIGTIFVFFIPPLLIANIVNAFSAHQDTSLSTLATSVALFGGSWIFGEFLWRTGMHFMIELETRGMQNLNTESFEELTRRDYDFYTNHFVGSITKQALAYQRSFETFTDTICFNIFNNSLPALFAIFILWQYSPFIPALLVACLIIVTFVAIPIIKRRAKLVALRHEAQSKMSGRLSDSITNILTIKSFAQEEFEQSMYGEHITDALSKWKRAADYQNLRFDSVISPLYVGTNVLGLAAAIFFAHKFGLQAGVLVVVFSYYSNVTRTFWEISRIYRNLESSVSEAAEFTQLMMKPPKVQDIKDAGKLNATDGTISFNNINFAYEGQASNSEMFLKNFSLDIKGNEKVGLVGPSGSGKTTITKLLLRFIDLNKGSITIDGQDISKVTQTSLRENIAYVPQEPLLFHRSLFENISYSNEHATEKEVIQAAKLARADEFIDKLPNGYKTLVGERGIKLSGGQRQRIAIARAILKHSRILILDEATSSLDSESEKYIQEGLLELMKDKTALVIVHRLSTIKHLDRILVLSDGKIVQNGTHEGLIKKKGLYATLWSHQSGEFLEE